MWVRWTPNSAILCIFTPNESHWVHYNGLLQKHHRTAAYKSFISFYSHMIISTVLNIFSTEQERAENKK